MPGPRLPVSCLPVPEGTGFSNVQRIQWVVVTAVNVYERDGKYQLYATKIWQDGAGELYEKFLELKEELEEMGMSWH